MPGNIVTFNQSEDQIRPKFPVNKTIQIMITMLVMTRTYIRLTYIVVTIVRKKTVISKITGEVYRISQRFLLLRRMETRLIWAGSF